MAIILAGMAMFVSGTTFLLILTLLGSRRFQYASKADLEELSDRMRILGTNQAKLFKYLEAVDDRTGGTGHRVLGVWMPGDDAKA